MSRSYKHFRNLPKGRSVIKEENSRFGKKSAVRAVRHAEDVADGGAYKKHYCSWNICDYRWFENDYDAHEFRKKWFAHDKEFDWLRGRLRKKNWKEAYREYIKCRRK